MSSTSLSRSSTGFSSSSLSFNQIQSSLHSVISTLDSVGNSVQVAVSTLFRKDLHDLVSGIRSAKGNESKFINDSIQEIKEELKSTDNEDKAIAILKLTYLQMLGYNMDWAAFRVIEVIAQSDFNQKRIGYLAASQSFSETTDVMVLITNMIRKDLLSTNLYDGGIALDCLANICTTELARDLVPDIVSMLSSARPYIRKKAVLVMYKIFLTFPDALRPSFPRLKEKLDDPDTAVVCAAVNVICELAKKNAKNYLPLAPIFFRILTKSTNNWMLIKVIKLFAVLIPLEDRLGKKLVEPLCNIINSTNSMSLMYEAIYTCIVGLSSYKNVIQLCSTKLRMFIEHPDQNLKYLGLLALSKIMEVFPKGIMEHRDLILNCLEDEDQTIRLRAVELLTGMVDRKNLSFIVDKLRGYLNAADGPYRDELLEKIIYICSQEKYKFISDFEWYIGILIDLTHVKGVKNGSIVSTQLLDVSVRVKVVRPFVVKQMLFLLQDKALLTEDVYAGSMCEALYAAAWILGEYADLCDEHYTAIDTLTHPEIMGLPAHIQSIFVHNALKVFAVMASQSKIITEEIDGKEIKKIDNNLEEAIKLLKTRLSSFTSSQHIEVQERASFFEQLLYLFEEQVALGVNISEELELISQDALNPVSSQAQSRVPKPESLNLDAWINDPIPDDEDDPFMSKKGEAWNEESEAPEMTSYGGFGGEVNYNPTTPTYPTRYVDPKEIERMNAQRIKERDANIFILKGDSLPEPPMRNFETDFPAEAALLRGHLPPLNPQPTRGRGGRARRGGRGPKVPIQEVIILTEEENPEGWKEPEVPVTVPSSNDELGKIDLTKEPEGDISLPARKHRTEMEPGSLPQKPALPPQPAPRSTRGRGVASRGRAVAPGRVARGRRAVRGRTGRAGRTLPPTQHKPETKEDTGPALTEEHKQAAPAKKTLKKRIFPLVKQSDLEITYELVSSKSQKNRILGIFHIKNLSTEPIEKATFSFTPTLNFSIAPHPSRTPQDPIPVESVPAGSEISSKLPFQFETFVQPQVFNGVFQYGEKSVPFDVYFPASSVIISTHIESAQLFNILKNVAVNLKTTEIDHVPLPQAINKVLATFHLSVIKKEEDKVSLYGLTVQDHHVAVLFRIKESKLEVLIKSDNAQLVESLCQEFNSIVW